MSAGSARAMTRAAFPCLHLICLALICLAPVPTARASQVDGMTLTATFGSVPGSVRLLWTGGQPVFSVFRSTQPATVVQPLNKIGEATDRLFEDATLPALGEVFFYELSSPCVYNPPEVCDSLDNDCDGTVDGPAADAACFQSCPGSAPGAACQAGTCLPRHDPLGTCGGAFIWKTPLGMPPSVTGLATDELLHPASPKVFVASGQSGLGALTAYSLQTGSLQWNTVLVSEAVGVAHVGSAILPGVVAVTDQGGFLNLVGSSSGAFIASSVDTRRTGVCTADTIDTAPTVQTNALSDTAFRSAMTASGQTNEDLVFVATHTGCGDVTRNRVFAVYAHSGVTRWVFNLNGEHMMDVAAGGCSLDYSSNTLFCGTYLTPGAYQNTLWAINTLDGSLRWSGNAGPILARPTIQGGRLYVVTRNGTVMAYDPAGLAGGTMHPLWSEPVQLPAPVTIELVPDQSQCAPVKLLARDQTGALHAIIDEGTAGRRAWSLPSAGAASFIGAPAMLGPAPYLYLAADNGTVHQIDPATGVDMSAVSHGFGTIVQIRAVELNLVPAILMTGSPGTVGVWCAPFALVAPFPNHYCSIDVDCALLGAPGSSPCHVGKCDVLSHACYVEVLAGAAPCSDGLGCTPSSQCEAGVCLATDNSLCPCAGIGDAACPAGQVCCGQLSGCVHLNTDDANCGACGQVCASGQLCVGGVCVTDSGVCGGGIAKASILNLAIPALTGADAITYARPGANQCDAYLTTYAASGTSAIKVVNPSGQVQTLTATGVTPMNGVAVSAAGDHLLGTVVNNPGVATPVPGFREIGGTIPGMPIVATGVATTGTAPFSESLYNTGPVGPALDTVLSVDPDLREVVYFGNWLATGDLFTLERTCPACAFTATPVAGWPTGQGRVTAITFENRPEYAVLPPVKTREVIVGQGSRVRILDLRKSTLRTIDLNATLVYGGVSAILSLAVHPTSGDIYAEVRDSTGAIQLLAIQAVDSTVRNLSTVHLDLHVAPAVPFFLSGEGRLSAASGILLERILLPDKAGDAPRFQDIRLFP